MNSKKLNILFLIDRTKVNKKNVCPIRCRLTYLGKRRVFSIGHFIKPRSWHSKSQNVKPPNTENNCLNAQLSLIKQQINQAFLMLQVNEKNFTVDDIYLVYQGDNTNTEIIGEIVETVFQIDCDTEDESYFI